MKIKTRTWNSLALIAVLAMSVCYGNAMAQEAPEVEAFISGIENYDESVISRPDFRGGNDEVPPNVLPDGESNDFVVGPRPVPERTIETSTSQSVANEVNSGANMDTIASDYFDQSYSSVYAPVAKTWVLGVSVPIFDRELDGDRLFSFNPADPSQALTSEQADNGTFSGIDVSLGRRSSNGKGFEARYWGLYPGADTQVLGGTPVTAINGLSQINDNGTSLSDTFNAADFHELTREFTLNNVELNCLRNGYTYAPLGRGMTVEWLGGFRYMQFDESLEYAAVAPGNAVIRSALNSSVENSLLGAQIGCRSEWHMFKRTSLSFGGKLGLFNNRAQNRIVATNQAPDLSFSRPVVTGAPIANTAFEFGDTKDDLSLMGEFDLGVIYQLTLRSRLRLGYRALGVSNIADAEQNIQGDFSDINSLGFTNTNSDLVLRGGYVGAEIAF